ncbi:MAG: DUF4012 domain-containing protein [Actinomycetota bacterium]|nr:DUF4012 domain-containing protein [Actinomycetota bacterium]
MTSTAPSPHPRRRRRRTWALLAVVAALAVVGAFTAYRSVRAGRQAMAAKAALLRAEDDLKALNFDATRTDLLSAQQSLKQMRAELDGMGPVLPVARWVPVVRSQVLAVEKFQTAGTLLSDAGLRLTDATQRVRETTTGDAPLSAVLERLRLINESLAQGAENVRVANAEVESLEGKLLIGPVAGARDELRRRLPRYERQATSAANGVSALIRFVGGDGSRRYLFLSQNPDEIRPTGGYIGTYGVITAGPDGLQLDSFRPIQDFYARHPAAVVPGTDAGSPFRSMLPPVDQSLGNVNSTPDFSKAGALAAQLWNGAGEPPIDGVVSVTPAFLGRLLGVLGPVVVPDYGETVDQSNLIERFDFYTEEENYGERKGFVASLAQVVMQKMLDAPASQWEPLAEAMAASFTAREAMAWATDPQVTTALADRGWDGVLPRTSGDFFYNGEFSFVAKANRGLRREFDHHVELRDDGSARITTVMTVTNTRPRALLNAGTPVFVTVYGPEGAKLDPASDPPASEEPALSGHPAAAWYVAAQPLSKATLKVVWEADNIAQERDGKWQYSLRWLKVPDHTGDVLNLRVDLPEGWEWDGPAPDPRIPLEADVNRTWVID